MHVATAGGAVSGRLLVVLAAVLCAASGAADAATVVIRNMDGPGEGFNDPTPVTPVGGNPGVTLGQQRLMAFTYAADRVAGGLGSPVTIVVEARFDPLACGASGATLGSAGANTVHRDFAGAPRPGTWYPQALANALAGQDLSPLPDIGATFNSDLDNDLGCLGGASWYYGLDLNAGGDIDFVTVVMHELCHGLGFQTLVGEDGARFLGHDDAYMVNLECYGASPPEYAAMTDGQRAEANTAAPDLVWVGDTVDAVPMPPTGTTAGYARIHAPDPYQHGSSLSHWSPTTSPDQLMEPSYTGPRHDLGLTARLFADIGWPVTVSAVQDGPAPVALRQNVPNPFNPATRIGFSLSEPAPVTLTVYDARGRRVKTLVDASLGAGAHDVVWDGCDEGGSPVGSGVYFYRIETGSFVASRKMVLLK